MALFDLSGWLPPAFWAAPMIPLALGIGLIVHIEDNERTIPFVLAYFAGMFGLLSLVLGNTFAAAVMALAVLLVLCAMSIAHSRFLDQPMTWETARHYDWLSLKEGWTSLGIHPLVTVAAVLVTSGFIVSLFWAVPRYDWDWRIEIGLAALGLAVMAGTRRTAFETAYFGNADRWHLSRFPAGLANSRLAKQNLQRLAVELTEPVELDWTIEPVNAAPHILLICQESTFSPALHGLAVEEDTKRFFEGSDRHRALKVRIFGGGTIVSMLAALTGLPSQIFPSNPAFVPRIWRDKIRASLPFFLKQHGYDAVSLFPVLGTWLFSSSFYRSIGFDAVLDSEVLTGSKRGSLKHVRDSVFYDAALESIGKRIKTGQARTFTVIETFSNHAPFNTTLYKDDPRVNESRRWFASANGTKVAKTAIEYYGRLRATIDDYALLREKIAIQFPGESFLLFHFGDHQPHWTADVRPVQEVTHYTTYAAVDPINFDLPKSRRAISGQLDVHNLDCLVAASAGLPANGYIAAKMDLLRAQEDGFAEQDKAFRAVLSALLQQGKLIERKENP